MFYFLLHEIFQKSDYGALDPHTSVSAHGTALLWVGEPIQ